MGVREGEERINDSLVVVETFHKPFQKSTSLRDKNQQQKWAKSVFVFFNSSSKSPKGNSFEILEISQKRFQNSKNSENLLQLLKES